MNEANVTSSGAARILRVHQQTVRKWAKKGWVPAIRTAGGHLRFSRAELQQWLQQHRAEDPD